MLQVELAIRVAEQTAKAHAALQQTRTVPDEKRIARLMLRRSRCNPHGRRARRYSAALRTCYKTISAPNQFAAILHLIAAVKFAVLIPKAKALSERLQKMTAIPQPEKPREIVNIFIQPITGHATIKRN